MASSSWSLGSVLVLLSLLTRAVWTCKTSWNQLALLGNSKTQTLYKKSTSESHLSEGYSTDFALLRVYCNFRISSYKDLWILSSVGETNSAWGKDRSEPSQLFTMLAHCLTSCSITQMYSRLPLNLTIVIENRKNRNMEDMNINLCCLLCKAEGVMWLG